MADTVILPDGTMEVILEDKRTFLEKLIRERLGNDAARCFTSCLSELTDELEDEKDIADGNEEAADGYLQMCRDALEQFSLIKEALKEQRLNRKRLSALVDEGYNDLYKNL